VAYFVITFLKIISFWINCYNTLQFNSIYNIDKLLYLFLSLAHSRNDSPWWRAWGFFLSSFNWLELFKMSYTAKPKMTRCSYCTYTARNILISNDKNNSQTNNTCVCCLMHKTPAIMTTYAWMTWLWFLIMDTKPVMMNHNNIAHYHETCTLKGHVLTMKIMMHVIRLINTSKKWFNTANIDMGVIIVNL